jgi:hypothetical protein
MLLVFREVTNVFVSKTRKKIKIKTRSPRKARAAERRIRMEKIASTNQRNGGHCPRRNETGLLRLEKSAKLKHPRLAEATSTVSSVQTSQRN